MSLHHEVYLLWKQPGIARRLHTAVSLHSHTSYSRESLDFLPHYMRRVPVLREFVARLEERHRRKTGETLDYALAYWTPPLGPQQVLASERAQIARRLGMNALVSITDHDRLDACTALRVMDGSAGTPLSLEWTVPFGEAQFHIGVHNLPEASAQSIAGELADYTEAPTPARLAELLASLDSIEQVLLVLNHPLSDQTHHLGRERHEAAMHEFLLAHRDRIHALELNGMHSAQENREVMEIAGAIGLPVISGGDRHGYECNANVNLTTASTFGEFVEEIRRERLSRVAFMPHYIEPRTLRILENAGDIVRYNTELSGREHWMGRVFYDGGWGPVPLADLMPNGGPALMRHGVALLDWLTHPRVVPTLRWMLADRGEVTL